MDIVWSLLDLILLHGDNEFQQNWFFFMDIELFSKSNPGGDFMYSPFYLRSILAILFVGVAHAVKRTSTAMYFGKRTVSK